MNLDIAFTPATADEQFDTACQQVANLLDDDNWKWLRSRINDEHLSWSSIMDLVANSI